MRKISIIIILAMQCLFLFSQADKSKVEQIAVLENGEIKRIISCNKGNSGITSASMVLKGSGTEFLNTGCEEFYFRINGIPVTGQNDWKVESVTDAEDAYQGKGKKIRLELKEPALKAEITYLLYPGLPIIRKKITFLNQGKESMNLEALDIERISLRNAGTGVHCWIMNDYARQKTLGQFISNWYDPVVVIHQADRSRGIVLGNEAPGVLKRTTAFLKPELVTAGLTWPDQTFPFRKWLEPGEWWESTWVFTGAYDNNDDPMAILNGAVNDYIRKHIGTRITRLERKPVFVYNTWEPFRHNIYDKLIYELADAAAECGFQEFVIDDGWQTSYGDWGIDTVKFPGGLKPVFDYIKSKGMKPGLWISLGAAEIRSNVYRDHPEWAVKNADGSPMNLHQDLDKMYEWPTYSMCMTTGWYDYIKGVIINLVKEHGLEYLKGDFAVVTGAYTTDKSRSGCYAADHRMHKDRNESMLMMYQRTWQLFDDFHREAPELFIDCTFETMGALQLIDIDMCKHADGNWLSNFGETSNKSPFMPLRIRQMGWWRTPSVPAAAMVIGNQHLDDPWFGLSLKSLTGTLPIVLGDPRKLTKEERAGVKSWSLWLQEMQYKHDFMAYRQDLPGYGEPGEGKWDGYQRINTDTKSGGIAGIFRNNSAETERRVTIQFLDPDARYEVKEAVTGKLIITATGKDLQEKGFKVMLASDYDGAVFEVNRM